MPIALAERLRFASLVATAAFLADWAAKSWALETLHQPRPLGALLLVVERNAAFAFSLGEGAPAVVIVAVRVALLAACVLLARRVAAHGVRYAAGFGLVLGGGSGNAADQLFRPEGVVDFIAAGPYLLRIGEVLVRIHVVFNGADLALLIGLGLLAPLIQTSALSVQRRIAAWERHLLGRVR